MLENALPVQKTPYLAQIGSFWPCQSKNNTLSGSDRPVLPENALPDTTAVSKKTTLSGSDRLVLLENAFPVQKTPYLAQIGSFCLKMPSQSKNTPGSDRLVLLLSQIGCFFGQARHLKQNELL